MVFGLNNPVPSGASGDYGGVLGQPAIGPLGHRDGPLSDQTPRPPHDGLDAPHGPRPRPTARPFLPGCARAAQPAHLRSHRVLQAPSPAVVPLNRALQPSVSWGLGRAVRNASTTFSSCNGFDPLSRHRLPTPTAPSALWRWMSRRIPCCPDLRRGSAYCLRFLTFRRAARSRQDLNLRPSD